MQTREWEHCESSLGNADLCRTEGLQELGTFKQKPLAGPHQPGQEGSAGMGNSSPLCVCRIFSGWRRVPSWSCHRSSILGAVGWHQACS